jgi:hypothetical protein
MSAPANHYTVERLIRQALMDAGRLQRGANPSAEVLVDAVSRLIDHIAMLQTQGLKLWLNRILTTSTAPGQNELVLGPSGSLIPAKPTRVLEGWIVGPAGDRTSLGAPLALAEYRSLGNLTMAGRPTAFHAEKGLTDLRVRLWPVPTAVETLELLIQEQAVTPPDLNSPASFPIEWYTALRWILADDLSSGQPAIIMERCERKAREFRAMLEDWDVEDAPTRFTMSPRF